MKLPRVPLIDALTPSNGRATKACSVPRSSSSVGRLELSAWSEPVRLAVGKVTLASAASVGASNCGAVMSMLRTSAGSANRLDGPGDLVDRRDDQRDGRIDRCDAAGDLGGDGRERSVGQIAERLRRVDGERERSADSDFGQAEVQSLIWRWSARRVQ